MQVYLVEESNQGVISESDLSQTLESLVRTVQSRTGPESLVTLVDALRIKHDLAAAAEQRNSSIIGGVVPVAATASAVAGAGVGGSGVGVGGVVSSTGGVAVTGGGCVVGVGAPNAAAVASSAAASLAAAAAAAAQAATLAAAGGVGPVLPNTTAVTANPQNNPIITPNLSSSVHFHSGVNQARDFNDPAGLQEKTEVLLREWIALYHSPSAGHGSSQAFTHFVKQMNLHGILKTDELITRFFRNCVSYCREICIRSLQEQQGLTRKYCSSIFTC